MIQVHVVLSLIGIAAGLVVLFGMVSGRTHGSWTALFLGSTILTSLTGFILPHEHLLPSDIIGIVSLVVLTFALVALYVYRLVGSWRWINVVAATVALYLNVFVGVVQAFEKFPFLNRLVPTQSEPPFLVAQVIVLVIFVVLGIFAAIRFWPTSPAGDSARR